MGDISKDSESEVEWQSAYFDTRTASAFAGMFAPCSSMSSRSDSALVPKGWITATHNCCDPQLLQPTLRLQSTARLGFLRQRRVRNGQMALAADDLDVGDSQDALQLIRKYHNRPRCGAVPGLG